MASLGKEIKLVNHHTATSRWTGFTPCADRDVLSSSSLTLSSEVFSESANTMSNPDGPVYLLPGRMSDNYFCTQDSSLKSRNDKGKFTLHNLQSSNRVDDPDPKVDDITVWINSIEISRERHRDNTPGDKIDKNPSGMYICSPGGDASASDSNLPRLNFNSQSEQNSKLKKKAGSSSRQRLNRKRSRTSDQDSEGNGVQQQSKPAPEMPNVNMLACPFVKHNPKRYECVNNSCTERFGFRTPGKVVEHCKRVHSRKLPCCTICKIRFSGRTRADAEHAQRSHEATRSCTPRELTRAESEWMSEEQEGLFSSSIINDQSKNANEKWKEIYFYLFKDVSYDDIPDPGYDYLVPRHLTNLPIGNSQDMLNQGTAYSCSEEYLQPVEYGFSTSGDIQFPELSIDPSHLLPDDASFNEELLQDNVNTINQFTQYRASQAPDDPWTDETGDMYRQNLREGNMSSGTQPTNQHTTIVNSLTSATLALNDQFLPPSQFPFAVYQGVDSGYHSIEDPSGPDTDGVVEKPELETRNEYEPRMAPSNNALASRSIPPEATPRQPHNTSFYLSGLGVGLSNSGNIGERNRFGEYMRMMG